VSRNKDTETKVVMEIMHLDNVGVRSRGRVCRFSLTVLMRLMKEWEVCGVVLGGDFNSTLDGEAYKAMEGGGVVKDLYGLVKERKGRERM